MQNSCKELLIFSFTFATINSEAKPPVSHVADKHKILNELGILLKQKNIRALTIFEQFKSRFEEILDTNATDLLLHADRMLYFAKETGRANVKSIQL